MKKIAVTLALSGVLSAPAMAGDSYLLIATPTDTYKPEVVSVHDSKAECTQALTTISENIRQAKHLTEVRVSMVCVAGKSPHNP